MEGYVNNGNRFFDAGALVNLAFDMSAKPDIWLKPSEICEIIAVPVTKGSAIQVGRWAVENGMQRRRCKGNSLILMPPKRAKSST
jgi:hypothetical protein